MKTLEKQERIEYLCELAEVIRADLWMLSMYASTNERAQTEIRLSNEDLESVLHELEELQAT